MWTGRQTLGEIEGALAKLRREEGQLDSALASAVAQAEKLGAERANALRELARIKLDEIAAGRLVRNLDAAEQRAMQILEGRRLRLEALNRQQQTLADELQQAERVRHEAAQEVEEAVEAVDTIRVTAEGKVRSSQAWADLDKAREAADRVAVEAEKKAEQSQAELGEKKKPYDDDPLFAYLWGRKFGTAAYSAGNIARMMDRRVADFIGYQEARASYAMLVEIPLRLREHANRQRKATDEIALSIAALERQAMVEEGVESKERALAEARHKLATADADAERRRQQLKQVEAQREALIGGSADSAYHDALKTIADADSQDDIGTLYTEAKRTGTPTDDMIVRRISGLDERIAELEKETASLRRAAREMAGRRTEVERVRDRFRTSGYDHPNATFRNDNEIAVVLGQILEGAVRSGILWDILRGGFGTRAPRGRPDFGSPTFPFPFPMPGGGEGARGGEWRQPGTRGGWSPPFDFPSGGGGDGGNDSDGFSTGGRF
jgi:chromosome segregation ATPase